MASITQTTSSSNEVHLSALPMSAQKRASLLTLTFTSLLSLLPIHPKVPTTSISVRIHNFPTTYQTTDNLPLSIYSPSHSSTMAHNPAHRTTRPRRAISILSDTPFKTPSPAVGARRSGTRAVRANTIEHDSPAHLPAEAIPPSLVPAHYTLPPTVPSPFAGTLEASLDAVLAWGTQVGGAQSVVNALCETGVGTTNWPILLRGLYLSRTTSNNDDDEVSGRVKLESLLFLLTRTLFPEQIAENRGLMARLYDKRKQLAIRLMLRYDMLREWKMDHSWHPIAIASLPPAVPALPAPTPITVAGNTSPLPRRPLMPNIWSTLIAAPAGGFTTYGVRERMKHHITDLDGYLLLSDKTVARWSDEVLLGMLSQIILQWQWLRQNNAVLEEIEHNDYEDLERRAEECEWIADDVRRPEYGKREMRGKADAGQ
jgi:hypothetical protein